jgi:hypothetical protein
MPARQSRTPRPASRAATPRAIAASHQRKLREAQEILEHGGGAIMAMTYMGHLGVNLSGDAVAAEAEEIAAQGLPSEEAMQSFQVRRLLHGIAAHSATGAVDAAAILYAHTVLNAVIDMLCAVSAEVDAPAWAIEIATVEAAADVLRALNTPDEGASRLAQVSLFEKCETLLRINKRSNQRQLLQDYKYSAPRLRKLDDLRLQLVHPSTFERKMKDGHESVEYLLHTAQFLINLLTQRLTDEAQDPDARPRGRARKASRSAEPVWQQADLF